MVNIYFHHSFYTYSWHSTVRKSFPFSIIYSFIPLYQYRLTDSYFNPKVVICYHHYLFWCSNCPRFSLQADSCVILTCPHYSLTVSLVSGTKRCFKLILYFSCSSPGIGYQLWFLLVENDIFLKLRSGLLMAYCYWVIIASRQLPLTNSIDCLFQNNVKEQWQILAPSSYAWLS